MQIAISTNSVPVQPQIELREKKQNTNIGEYFDRVSVPTIVDRSSLNSRNRKLTAYM